MQLPKFSTTVWTTAIGIKTISINLYEILKRRDGIARPPSRAREAAARPAATVATPMRKILSSYYLVERSISILPVCGVQL